MFDSSTKIPEGVLIGNIVQLGNWDECIAVKHPKEIYDGQHCLVTIDFDAPADASAAERAWVEVDSLKNQPLITDLGDLVTALRGISIKMALCVPSTCSAQDLQKGLTYSLSEYNVSISVNPDQCHTRKLPTLRFIDWIAIFIIAFFIALAFASTFYDVWSLRQGLPTRPLLVSFSVYSNWLRLISINNNTDTLQCLHGIRFISMAWVVLGHRYLVNGSLPSVNMMYLNDFKKDWTRLSIMNATLSVDTFFLLSGLLMSYVFLKEVEKRGKFDVVLFYVHRYIRLTPPMAIMVLLTATLFNYADTGPLWDSRHRVYSENCEKNWWANLLYINNYYDAGNICLGQSWYLAVDMQLYWFSPIVLIPLWKKPRLAQFLILLLIVVGCGIAFTVPYVEEYYAGVWTGPEEKRTVSQHYDYYPTHTRYVPWLMGIALGYYIRIAKIKKLKLSQTVVLVGWVFATILTVGALHLAYPFQQPDYVYGRVESSLFISLFRPAWALGVGWIIFACDLGYGGLANKILSWQVFQPLGRLSYGIYLTHVSVLIVLTSSIKTPTYLADVSTIPQFLGDLMMSIAWSIPLALLFESPILLIEKTLLGKSGSGNANRPAPAAVEPHIGKKDADMLDKGVV